MAVESKPPEMAGSPSGQTANARTGPPWPRNCANEPVIPSSIMVSNAAATRTPELHLPHRETFDSVNCMFSAYTGLITVQTLGLEIVKVILKTSLGIGSEISQERPGVDAGGVHIVEPNSHGIVADGIDRQNRHVPFSANRLALRLGVTLDFGGRAGDPKQFRGKAESLAIVECHLQRSAIPDEADFERPCHTEFRRAQASSCSVYLRPVGPPRTSTRVSHRA